MKELGLVRDCGGVAKIVMVREEFNAVAAPTVEQPSKTTLCFVLSNAAAEFARVTMQ
jgi:hypothetical protein